MWGDLKKFDLIDKLTGIHMLYSLLFVLLLLLLMMLLTDLPRTIRSSSFPADP
jgi:hypothetical protein